MDSDLVRSARWVRAPLGTWLAILTVVVLAISVGWHLAACEATGATTVGVYGPVVDLLVSTGGQIKTVWRSWTAVGSVALACLLCGVIAAIRSRERAPEIALTVTMVVCLLAALSLRSLDRPFFALAPSLALAIVAAAVAVRQPAVTSSHLTRLAAAGVLALALAIGTLLRLYALAEHPHGFPEHAVAHNLPALQQFASSLSLQDGPPLRDAWNGIMVQFGLQSFLEVMWFKAFGVGFLQSMALPALLGIGSVGLAFGVGRELFGIAEGAAFSLLTAVSSWQIAFSRYGDPEHSLPVFQVLLTLFLGLRALRRRSVALGFACGLALGVSWFVYGTNQIVPIIAISALAAALITRPRAVGAYRWVIAAIVLGFVLMSGDVVRRSWQLGYFYPVRTALPANENYRVVSLSATMAAVPQALSILMVESGDAWFARKGGALSDLEAALLIPALLVGVVCVARGVDRAAWSFLIFALVVSLLPGIASPEMSIRRIMLAALLCGLIIAAGLARLVPTLNLLLPRIVWPFALAGAVLLHSAAAAHGYFVDTRQPHSESHAYDTAVARWFARRRPDAPVKVFVRTESDGAVQFKFIKLAAYDILPEVREPWETAYRRYTIRPGAMSSPAPGRSCPDGGQVLVRDYDEKLFHETLASAALLDCIDPSSRSEYRDAQAGVGLVKFNTRWYP